MLVTNILLGIVIVVLFAILDILCGRAGAYQGGARVKTIHEFLIELPDRHLALYDIEICSIIKRHESSFEYSVYKNIHDKNMMEVRLLAEPGAVRGVKYAIETELGLLVTVESED